jgi:polysaccharide deacetylase 2 family uncharacterized protein YibQ
MAADTLNDDETPRRRGVPALAIAWFSFIALLVLVAILTTLLGDPRADEPLIRMAVVRLGESLPHRTALTPPSPPIPNMQTVLPPALVPPAITKPVFAGRALVADPALVEVTASGPLPKIASDGRTPMKVYAGAMIAPAQSFRIAIIISGLGISAKQTADALQMLPPQVTLAFAPYASDVQRWTGEARKEGHEILVEVPMEPYEFPDSDPGPHTLRAGQGEDANTERLVWALTRFTGYTGATNMQGSRFLSDADSLAPVLTYLARRGLLFFDNGEASHSVAPDVAGRVGIPFAHSVAQLDKIETAMEIDRQLSNLETEARSHGSAAGAGFLYPVTLQRVAAWAQGLSGRGFVLVPATGVVSQTNAQ